MGKLIRFEIRKLFRSKYFYVLTAVIVAFVLISGLTAMAVNTFLAGEGGIGLTTFYPFVKSSIGGTSFTILGIFVAIFVCEDSAQGTTKSFASKGYSRIAIFYSKYIVSLLAFIFITLIGVLTAILFGSAVFEHTEITDNLVLVVFGALVSVMAYHALYFMLSYIFNKIGAAIALNIIGPMGVTLVLTMADAALRNETFKLSDYWLDGIYASLLRTNPNTQTVVVGFILLAVYIALSISIGAIVANKKEIK